MNMNQGGMDSRFAQFQGGQGQPGAAGFAGLGGMPGLQSLPGGGFNLQGRPGGISGMAGAPGQAANLAAAQQQRLGAAAGPAGLSNLQQQLGLQQQGAPRMGVPGQQQFSNANLRMAGPAGVGVNNAYMTQQQQAAGAGGGQQGGLPGRGTLGGNLGNLGPGAGLSANLNPFQTQGRMGAATGQGGIAATLSGLNQRSGALGGVGGYGGAPSGDLLTMLNKNPGGVGQRQEEGASFNASDFPSLSPAGPQGGRLSGQDGGINDSFANLINQKGGAVNASAARSAAGMPPQPQQGAAFGEEDFPALPGAGLASQMQQQMQHQVVSDAAYDALRMQQQRQMQLQQQQQQQQQQQAAAAAAAGMKQPGTPGSAGSVGGAPDRFGLLGLLSVIRMTDPDVTTLALGTDLTTLGLNLNSPEALWKTFASPWADGPGKPEPDFRTPTCYLTPPPRLSPAYFSRFQPDTLFYIFYGMPGDEAQVYAADELASRGWYYHKELKAWLTRAPNSEPVQKTDRFERGAFFLFDPSSWDVVRKDNFSVSFDALERPPGVLKSMAGASSPGGGMPMPPPGAVGPPPQQGMPK